ncbi:hypothetical protein SB379_29405, partial [Burkholderia multivorans]|uniref:hypothetical protein n=1 Tax=Burkholderia multivorans TaxID=87883 RepID=UPI002B242ECC
MSNVRNWPKAAVVNAETQFQRATRHVAQALSLSNLPFGPHHGAVALQQRTAPAATKRGTRTTTPPPPPPIT